MRLSRRRVLKWGIPAALVLLAVIYVVISYLIASGVTNAERKPLEDHPQSYDLRYDDVEFTSRDGDVTLRGWYLPANDRAPTLIFVHGITSNRTADEAMDLAARLIKEGFNILMFDLRGHGESDGERVSGGYHERQDVLGAFDFLEDRGTPIERVGVLGFSMGAGTSLLVAAEEPRMRALVADSTYAKVSDLIAQETARTTVFPEWIVPVFVPGARLLADWLYGIKMGELVPEEAVSRIDYPILVIHGTADTRIRHSHGVRVHQAAHPDSEIWLVPEVDHVDAFLTFPEEYVERVVAYFRERLDEK